MILKRIYTGNYISFKAKLTMTLSTLVFGKIYNKSDCLMTTLKWKISSLIKWVIINGIYIELFWSSYSLWVTNQNLGMYYAYVCVFKTRASWWYMISSTITYLKFMSIFWDYVTHRVLSVIPEATFRYGSWSRPKNWTMLLLPWRLNID